MQRLSRHLSDSGFDELESYEGGRVVAGNIGGTQVSITWNGRVYVVTAQVKGDQATYKFSTRSGVAGFMRKLSGDETSDEPTGSVNWIGVVALGVAAGLVSLSLICAGGAISREIRLLRGDLNYRLGALQR